MTIGEFIVSVYRIEYLDLIPERDIQAYVATLSDECLLPIQQLLMEGF